MARKPDRPAVNPPHRALALEEPEICPDRDGRDAKHRAQFANRRVAVGGHPVSDDAPPCGHAESFRAIAWATAGGGNPYLDTPDRPNTGWLFIAGLVAITGIVCGLIGLYRLLQTIDRIGGVTLRTPAQRGRLTPRAARGAVARADASYQAAAAASRRSTKPPTS